MAVVPSVVEAGYPDLVATIWYGLAAPRGTPAAAVARLNAAVQAGQAQQQIRAALAQNGADAFTADAAAHDRFLHAEVARWGEVVRAARVQVE